MLPSCRFTFTPQKVNRQDGSMAAIAAAERQRAVSQIRKRDDPPSTDSDDLRRPADIRVPHGNRLAAAVAPYIGLKIREVRVPGDVDAGRMIAGASQERANLRWVALEQYNLNRQLRLFVKVASHAFPNRHHLWIVCDSSHPDRAHAVSPLRMRLHETPTM